MNKLLERYIWWHKARGHYVHKVRAGYWQVIRVFPLVVCEDCEKEWTEVIW